MALAVLECLHECPRHPYEIHQTMQEREVWRMIKVTPGSLYHTIERLARDELIEVVETSRAGRRPERTTYRITEAGQDAFAERLRAMIAEPATEYPQYPVAVGMLHELERDDALVQLRRRTIALEAQLAADQVVEKRVAEAGVHPLYWADVELRRRQRETELDFTRELIDRIVAGRVTWPPKKRQLTLVEKENFG
jgi:DNA-binding PadR family transcriptional regulator